MDVRPSKLRQPALVYVAHRFRRKDPIKEGLDSSQKRSEYAEPQLEYRGPSTFSTTTVLPDLDGPAKATIIPWNLKAQRRIFLTYIWQGDKRQLKCVYGVALPFRPTAERLALTVVLAFHESSSIKKISRAKAQRRKALPRFARSFFAPLREKYSSSIDVSSTKVARMSFISSGAFHPHLLFLNLS